MNELTDFQGFGRIKPANVAWFAVGMWRSSIQSQAYAQAMVMQYPWCSLPSALEP